MKAIFESVKVIISSVNSLIDFLCMVLLIFIIYPTAAIISGFWWSDWWLFDKVNFYIGIFCLICVWIFVLLVIIAYGKELKVSIKPLTKFFTFPFAILSLVGFLYGAIFYGT